MLPSAPGDTCLREAERPPCSAAEPLGRAWIALCRRTARCLNTFWSLVGRSSQPHASQHSPNTTEACPVVPEEGLDPVPCCFVVRGRSGECRVTCDSHSPTVTARAHREPAVSDAVRTQRGPRSRAWKARPGSPSTPDATPMAQVKPPCDRPLLTVRDRQMPVLRARGGHGRRGPTALQGGGDGHKLYRRVRPVHDDHLPRWQGRQARGSWTEGVRTRRQTPTASPVDAVRCADLEARDVAAWMQRKGLLILCG